MMPGRVRGFVFDDTGDQVKLLKTENDVRAFGGEIAGNELPIESMSRHYAETCGLVAKDWHNFVLRISIDGIATWYFCLFDSFLFQHERDEKIVIKAPLSLIAKKASGSLEWYIHRALISQGRPPLIITETHQIDATGVIAPHAA